MAGTPVKGEPVGLLEIAQRLGVKQNTVQMWRKRGVFTVQPRWKVSGMPAWLWSDVEQWAKATGRGRGEVRADAASCFPAGYLCDTTTQG